MKMNNSNIENLLYGINILIIFSIPVGTLGTFLTNSKVYLLVCLAILGGILIIRGILEIQIKDLVATKSVQKYGSIFVGILIILISLISIKSKDPLTICFGHKCKFKQESQKYTFR